MYCNALQVKKTTNKKRKTTTTYHIVANNGHQEFEFLPVQSIVNQNLFLEVRQLLYLVPTLE